jgi:hypothetical protein
MRLHANNLHFFSTSVSEVIDKAQVFLSQAP